MKKLSSIFFSAILLCSLLVITSCGDDESECSDAVATGSINGKAFNFQTGRAFESDGELDIRLFSDEVVIDDVCSFSSAFGDNAISLFGDVPMEVGRTDLFLDLAANEGFTLTLFDAEGFSNIIASEGFIEITEISDSIVRGFLSADAGGGDMVCGTFELTRC